MTVAFLHESVPRHSTRFASTVAFIHDSSPEHVMFSADSFEWIADCFPDAVMFFPAVISPTWEHEFSSVQMTKSPAFIFLAFEQDSVFVQVTLYLASIFPADAQAFSSEH